MDAPEYGYPSKTEIHRDTSNGFENGELLRLPDCRGGSFETKKSFEAKKFEANQAANWAGSSKSAADGEGIKNRFK